MMALAAIDEPPHPPAPRSRQPRLKRIWPFYDHAIRGLSGARGQVKVWLALAGAISGPAQAQAQVLEIHADGSVMVHEAPSVFTLDGVSKIALPEARSASTELGPTDVRWEIGRAAAQHGLAPGLLEAVAWQESRFHPKAVSPKGAVGVMQLTEAAARDVGADRHDVQDNIRGGAAYLRRMIDTFGGDVSLALAAYNAGPGAVRRYGGVPPYQETQAYVTAILRRVSAASGRPLEKIVTP